MNNVIRELRYCLSILPRYGFFYTRILRKFRNVYLSDVEKAGNTTVSGNFSSRLEILKQNFNSSKTNDFNDKLYAAMNILLSLKDETFPRCSCNSEAFSIELLEDREKCHRGLKLGLQDSRTT